MKEREQLSQIPTELLHALVPVLYKYQKKNPLEPIQLFFSNFDNEEVTFIEWCEGFLELISQLNQHNQEASLKNITEYLACCTHSNNAVSFKATVSYYYREYGVQGANSIKQNNL
jgi:hypothetical protein